MTVPERLQKIIADLQMTPAQFADEIGVQRSGISHILSGRNNPGFDFLQKVLSRFPSVDAVWFISGKVNDDKVVVKEIHTPATGLFDLNEQTGTKVSEPNAKMEENLLNDEDLPIYGNNDGIAKEKLPIREDKVTGIQYKKPIKVIEFFDDGTFKLYVPE